MIVSLPSSLTGVVRRKEVSDHFYLKAAASGGHKQANRGGGGAGGRGRYFEDASADDKPLKELFREGQVNKNPRFSKIDLFLWYSREPHAFRRSVLFVFYCNSVNYVLSVRTARDASADHNPLKVFRKGIVAITIIPYHAFQKSVLFRCCTRGCSVVCLNPFTYYIPGYRTARDSSADQQPLKDLFVGGRGTVLTRFPRVSLVICFCCCCNTRPAQKSLELSLYGLR